MKKQSKKSNTKNFLTSSLSLSSNDFFILRSDDNFREALDSVSSRKGISRAKVIKKAVYFWKYHLDHNEEMNSRSLKSQRLLSLLLFKDSYLIPSINDHDEESFLSYVCYIKESYSLDEIKEAGLSDLIDSPFSELVNSDLSSFSLSRDSSPSSDSPSCKEENSSDSFDDLFNKIIGSGNDLNKKIND